MIICGNVYLDEINKTFLLQCVLCEKKSKVYSEFTKHIRRKHKSLETDSDPTPLQSLEIEILKKENDPCSENEEEKPLIQIKHEMEMDVMEDFNDEFKYGMVEEMFVDPVALEEKETLDIPTDDFDCEIKDEDYNPDDDSDEYEENYDNYLSSDGSESEHEEIPAFTDKFNPTFFRQKRFLNDFLDLYKNQPVLWNVNHPDFENVPARKEAEDEISEGMHKFNVFMKSIALKRALDKVHKYVAIIKHSLETDEQKKYPEVTLAYYNKCEFLKPLIAKRNISGIQNPAHKKPLQFKIWDEKTSTFIDIYETFPILYDGNHSSYGDVDGRQVALNEFANILKDQHDLDFNEEIVTNAIEQLQSWYYPTRKRKEGQNNKLNKHEEKYLKKCKKFMPNERLRYRYICSVCKKNFHLRHNLQVHLHKIHQIGDLPFSCGQCERKFESRFALKGHVQRVHVGKTYPCKFCDRKFAVPAELKIHSSIHSTEKPHTCELCGKSFRLKVQLGYHVTAIHTKIRAFKCTMCPKDFLKKRDLTDHIKSHLNIRDKICETCGKGFSNCHSLIRHRQIHSEVKKFACKLCDAKFHQFVGLNGHMKRTHNIVKKPI